MPPKINLGDQSDRAKLVHDIYTHESSNLAVSAGKQSDDSERTVNVVDLPARIDSLQLANELAQLVAASKNQPVEPQKIQALRDAEVAARQGDRSKIPALLRKAGSWALESATKLGIEVAVTAFKASLGQK